MSDPASDVTVRGNATADELAALLAALARRPSAVDDPYERWRRGRIAALARSRVVGPPPR
jgi:hypothetical protein